MRDESEVIMNGEKRTRETQQKRDFDQRHVEEALKIIFFFYFFRWALRTAWPEKWTRNKKNREEEGEKTHKNNQKNSFKRESTTDDEQ